MAGGEKVCVMTMLTAFRRTPVISSLPTCLGVRDDLTLGYVLHFYAAEVYSVGAVLSKTLAVVPEFLETYINVNRSGDGNADH